MSLPRWYGPGSVSVFNAETRCTSPSLTVAQQAGDTTAATHTILYSKYTPPSSGMFEIKCTKYNNPVSRQIVNGFGMQITDLEALRNLAVVLPQWSLDATEMATVVLDSAANDQIQFSFKLEGSTTTVKPIPIQTPAAITLSFRMPIPVETSDEGCLLKVTFPNDFPLTATPLMFQGGGMMRTPSGGGDLARNA